VKLFPKKSNKKKKDSLTNSWPNIVIYYTATIGADTGCSVLFLSVGHRFYTHLFSEAKCTQIRDMFTVKQD